MSDEIWAFSELLHKAAPILSEMRDADCLRPPTFNIFRILGLQYREVGTHSALLAHLLDPESGHNQGTLFLQSFLDVVVERAKVRGQRLQLPIEIGSNWRCRPEVRLPNGHGQVDILIQGPSFSMLIENKIYAADQPNQLYRYWDYARKLWEHYVLVYLTPHGVPPSPQSLLPPTSERESQQLPSDDSMEKRLTLLSYREDIRGMMLRSAKETQAVSIAEILRQYADLVGTL
jgi:hypothetical protein